MSDYIVELKNVTISFDGELIFENISMNFPYGKLIAITGPSGNGKSTLLKVAAGLVAPDSGTVIVEGIDIQQLSRPALFSRRRNHAFVFQDAALLSNLNVYNNLALPLRYHYKLSEREIEKRVLEMLRNFDLESEQMQLPAQLSSGQRKLAAFARGLIIEPRLIFLDEPVSGVDAIAREKMLNNILSLKDNPDISVIMVSHSIDFIKSAADYIALIYKKKLFAYGPRDEILKSEDPVIQRILSIIYDEEAAVAEAVLGVLTGGDQEGG